MSIDMGKEVYGQPKTITGSGPNVPSGGYVKASTTTFNKASDGYGSGALLASFGLTLGGITFGRDTKVIVYAKPSGAPEGSDPDPLDVIIGVLDLRDLHVQQNVQVGLSGLPTGDFTVWLKVVHGRPVVGGWSLTITPMDVVRFSAAMIGDGTDGLQLVDPDGAVVAGSEVVEEVQANASATTVVLSGPGEYFAYRCTAAAGNITIYDSLTATGKVLVPTQALQVGVFPLFGPGSEKTLKVDTGICVVLSGAATVYVSRLKY